jgi:hypothetical protein
MNIRKTMKISGWILLGVLGLPADAMAAALNCDRLPAKWVVIF